MKRTQAVTETSIVQRHADNCAEELTTRRKWVALVRAVWAEWGKVTSVRAPVTCLLAAALTSAVAAASLANDFVYGLSRGEHLPDALAAPADIVVPALQLGSLIAFAGIMLVMTGEFGTSSAASTFTAQPRRGVVVGAKVVVAAFLGLVCGLVTAALSAAATVLILGSHAAQGPSIWAVVVRAGILWAALAVLTIGLATLIRSGVGTLGALFVMLVGLLMVSERIGRFLPAEAGGEFVTGVGASYPSGVGLLVVAGWAAVVLAVGTAALNRRDL